MKIIKSTSLKLESGLLLSREILEQMDSQSHLFKLQYDSYPDGIIYGFEYIIENSKPYLSSGLIKFNGKYFFSEEKIDLNTFFDEFDSRKVIDNTMHSAIAFVSGNVINENEGIVSDSLELKLCDVNELKSVSALLLAEFQYHSHKRISKPERTAEEELHAQLYSKEYYYTFLNVNYSMPYENTFSPYIFDLMKKCLSEKVNKTSADLGLLFMLCQNRVISLEVLKEWFNYNGMTVDFSDRKDIIKCFLKAVKTERKTESRVVKIPVKKPNKNENVFGI